MRLALQPHPETPSGSVTSIQVEVERLENNIVELHYFVSGKISHLQMPPVGAPLRSDRLWEHSCFEAFVRTASQASYYEYNLSPSTCWASYRFADYRAGMHFPVIAAPPEIHIRVTSKTFVLSTNLMLDGLPLLPGAADWHVGLSAVIEEINGKKSYWAIAHAHGPPDFHHRDCFAHELKAPTGL